MPRTAAAVEAALGEIEELDEDWHYSTAARRKREAILHSQLTERIREETANVHDTTHALADATPALTALYDHALTALAEFVSAVEAIQDFRATTYDVAVRRARKHGIPFEAVPTFAQRANPPGPVRELMYRNRTVNAAGW